MSNLTFFKYELLLTAMCQRCYHPNYLSADTITENVTCAKCNNTIKHKDTIKAYQTVFQKEQIAAFPKEWRVPFCTVCYTEFEPSALQEAAITAIQCQKCQTITPFVQPNTLLKSLLPRLCFTIGKSPKPLPVLVRKEHQIKCLHCQTILENELNGTEIICQACHKNQFIPVEMAMQLGGTKAFTAQAIFLAFDFGEPKIVVKDELKAPLNYQKSINLLQPNPLRLAKGMLAFIEDIQQLSFPTQNITVINNLDRNQQNTPQLDYKDALMHLGKDLFFYQQFSIYLAESEGGYRFLDFNIHTNSIEGRIEINIQFYMQTGSKKLSNQVQDLIIEFLKSPMNYKTNTEVLENALKK